MLGAGRVVRTDGFAGGGALPEERIPSRAVALRARDRGGCGGAALRAGRPAVVGRIADGRLLLDMLAVSDDELRRTRRRAADRAGVTRLVLGVIGHVDHGKTALVRALTGHGHRPAAGGEAARHLDRARLRASRAPGRTMRST